MKTLGIIGGIAPASTMEYYRLIISTYRQKIQDGSYPQLLINSIDMKKMLDLISTDNLPAVTDYLLSEIKKLFHAGANYGLLASNTPHIVFNEIQRQSPIPLISIVEAACSAARKLNLKKVGLFGTLFTMQGGFYSKAFSKAGIELVLPGIDEQEFIHNKYMSELVNGIFTDKTRSQLLSIVYKMKKDSLIQALILGGTELPFILRDMDVNDILFLDTTKIHVESAVNEMFSD